MVKLAYFTQYQPLIDTSFFSFPCPPPLFLVKMQNVCLCVEWSLIPLVLIILVPVVSGVVTWAETSRGILNNSAFSL